MKNSFLTLAILLFATLILSSCNTTDDSQETENVALKKNINTYSAPLLTKKDGVLTVLMDNSLTSYFIYQGQAMGYEYEMLALFADENNLTLEVKIIQDIENILDSLLYGQGDLVAANLTISSDRMEKVAFSSPLFRTQQVLVQRLPDNRRKLTKDQIEKSLIRDRLDLDNKAVMVRKNSSYELMLKNLTAETGMNLQIHYSPGDYVTEHMIDMVANKEIDFTICDLNKAQIFNSYYDNLDIQTPMSLSQPIAWAVNKSSTELIAKLNAWIENRQGSLEYNMISNRYFEMNRRKRQILAREYDYVKGGKISDYDELIKKHAATIGWDWRLITSQIYKESRFDPKTKSWRGAVGLMQLMPRTAASYGLKPKDLTNPEANIQGGIRHLQMLEDHWKKTISDSLELIKFTLGSYNVGHGHVEDAIRLCEKYELNSQLWDDHVAKMLLNKSIPKYYKDPMVKYGYCRGREPVNYVTTILKNYELYKQFTD